MTARSPVTNKNRLGVDPPSLGVHEPPASQVIVSTALPFVSDAALHHDRLRPDVVAPIGVAVASTERKESLVYDVVGDVRLRDHGGRRLHPSHQATNDGEPSLADGPPRAQGTGGATDYDRVGVRQQLPRGSIDGPCILRGSNGTPSTEATQAARHPTAGAAAPRTAARMSVSVPHRSRVSITSAAHNNSHGASRASARGAPSAKAIGHTIGAGCATPPPRYTDLSPFTHAANVAPDINRFEDHQQVPRGTLGGS